MKPGETFKNNFARGSNVIVNEVQEILTNKPKFRFVEKGHYLGENVYFALGQRLDATSLFSLSLKRTNVL